MSSITLPSKILDIYVYDIDPSLCGSTREYVERLPLDLEGLNKAIKILVDAPENTTELSEAQIECRLEIAQHFKEVCHYEDPTDPDENKVTSRLRRMTSPHCFLSSKTPLKRIWWRLPQFTPTRRIQRSKCELSDCPERHTRGANEQGVA